LEENAMTTWARELVPTHGQTRAANLRRDAERRVPHIQEIMDLPAANSGVYMLTENEIKSLRSRVYSLNKNNAFGWRWRTLVEPGRGRYSQLLVWRIH
jgi:hypothetical protein